MLGHPAVSLAMLGRSAVSLLGCEEPEEPDTQMMLDTKPTAALMLQPTLELRRGCDDDAEHTFYLDAAQRFVTDMPVFEREDNGAATQPQHQVSWQDVVTAISPRRGEVCSSLRAERSPAVDCCPSPPPSRAPHCSPMAVRGHLLDVKTGAAYCGLAVVGARRRVRELSPALAAAESAQVERLAKLSQFPPRVVSPAAVTFGAVTLVHSASLLADLFVSKPDPEPEQGPELRRRRQ